MNTLLQAVGKNVIESNSLEDVISSQNKILIEYFVNQFSDNIKFKNEYFDVTIKTTTEAFKISKETIFNIELLDSVKIEKVFNKEWEKINTIKKKFSELLTALDEKIIVETFDYYKIYNSFTKNIYPIISTDKKLEKFFEERMISELGMQISGLPF